ncbi:MAG TPA: CpsB/CapC family capsule biosynthesis tyrosine phosphatase [Thermoleophilaceae bacterium]|nr:CpsB/CapC family capsule biosynthesis tyrosine phosphatase [Thermoleophilaceae bacterium]
MLHVDLHFHLLPGVDDGPADLDESLDLARAALRAGTGTVVATPHVRPDLGLTDTREILERVRELRAALAAAGLPLEITCGGELGHDMAFDLTRDELDLLAQGPRGSRWLLVETPFHGIGEDFHAATAALRALGFGVLVAHPERSADAALDGAAGLRRELAAGSLAQVNAPSLTGGHGEDARRSAWGLLEEDLVAVIASDAHGPTRPPALRQAYETLVDGGVAPAAANALVATGPRTLLAQGMSATALAA